VQKRQGASTFQMVHNQKPSAQEHNKRKKAKGFRPYKWSEPKKPSAKKRLESIERRMPERAETFFLSEPSASIIRQTSEATPRKKGGRRFSKNKICAHCLLWQQLVTGTNHDHQKHKPQTYGMGTPTNQVRERGETFFLKIPRT